MLPLLVLAAPVLDPVYVDAHATLRWRKDGREVVLFGANYCLPSALDYRAAKAVGADPKALVREDMAHFARMGFDGLRFSFWGDWENTDHDGNLKPNGHLDLMDYTIAKGAKRGIRFLLSPIVTYDARWPEMKEYPEVADGLSRVHPKATLGTDPVAIKAQQNYLRQLLEHVNPYTGRALKDEPSIAFVEMINEPWHHADDPAGSVRYIDALVQAVRDTGCRKPTFHNLSQDFRMAGPINDSKVDGATYAWYPSGLNANHQLRGDFLRYLDDYAPMRRPEVHKKPVIVYEFDLPDTVTGYGYPAMVREFRKTGAQFAAMFSYDMLATAPYNLGWTTHLLNLVYTPKKAAAAIIAGEAMRRLPRFGDYGAYPANKRFGDFRVEDDHAELDAKDALIYTGDTTTRPAPTVRRLVGLGSSPAVRYPGQGLYFLDRLGAGAWRLEVYPDALQVADPFHDPAKGELKFRLVARTWPMTLRLPGLGTSFRIRGLDHAADATARAGTFPVRPGVYLLAAPGAKVSLPAKVAGVGLREFVCPRPTGGPANVSLEVPRTARVGAPLVVRAQVVADADPRSVVLEANGTRLPMRAAGPYAYAATLRPEAGPLRLRVVADGVAAEAATSVLAPDAPVVLFDPIRDARTLAVSRSGEARNAVEALVSGSAEGRSALNLRVPLWLRTRQEDFTVSTYLGGLPLGSDGTLAVRLRGKGGAVTVHLTLVDRDGNAWGAPIHATDGWRSVELPLADLKPVRWAMLPQAYPGTWSYWAESIPGASLVPERLERLQLSLRAEEGLTAGSGVEVEGVALLPRHVSARGRSRGKRIPVS